MRINSILLIAAVALITTSCNKQIDIHGFNFEHADLSAIKIHETSKQRLIEEIGSPTAESDFGEKKLYYISTKTEKIAFLAPKVLEQRILCISLDGNNTVKKIDEFTLSDANKIAFSENYTDIQGNGVTAMQQILGNIGKYNKKK
ncbi:MAG: SmpA / OmlA family protein [Candidatus Midichloriaceae bacterium]|jgi:outer membrane protein assembly factor BamE (lipoprotein component of BamABCDE complex)|nr:SmpA / OmlA family protein [Candidatus Midichloriaceae bacterium]